jgi:septal ring factor EnvC (AmiA/AmiB activator)
VSIVPKMVPAWAVITVLIAPAILVGVQTYRLKDLQVIHATYVGDVKDAKARATAQAQATQSKIQADLDQVRTDASTQKATDDALAARQRDDNRQLQQQITGVLADRTRLRARLAKRGKTVEDLTDLLAQLRSEADDYAGELASALTASRRSGFACERSYDAVRAAR